MRDLTQVRMNGKTLNTTSILRLEQDDVKMPDGSMVQRIVIRKSSASVIIPITERGTVLLVRQWRYAVAQALLELPAGVFDEDEDPLTAAQRELREETGYRAEKMVKLFAAYPAPGICDELLHFFLATGLYPDPLLGDEDEDIEVVEMSFEEAIADERTHKDCKTILGLLMAQRHLTSR